MFRVVLSYDQFSIGWQVYGYLHLRTRTHSQSDGRGACEISLANVRARSATTARRIRMAVRTQLDALFRLGPTSNWRMSTPCDAESFAYHTAYSVVDSTIARTALWVAESAHVLCVRASMLQPAIDALARAKRDDDCAFETDAMLCENLRRRGVPITDARSWLYEA